MLQAEASSYCARRRSHSELSTPLLSPARALAPRLCILHLCRFDGGGPGWAGHVVSGSKPGYWPNAARGASAQQSVDVWGGQRDAEGGGKCGNERASSRRRHSWGSAQSDELAVGAQASHRGSQRSSFPEALRCSVQGQASCARQSVWDRHRGFWKLVLRQPGRAAQRRVWIRRKAQGVYAAR